MNKQKLLISACVKFLLGAVLVGLLLFLSAGTIHYKNGWLFMAILFLPMLLAGLVMWTKSPALLASRLKAKENQWEQRQVVAASGLMFLGGFITAGLDFRYGWSDLPLWLELGAAVVFLLSYGMYGEVLRENAYLSRTIEVQAGQKVVDTGLYGVVRHPMYLATVLLFLSMPLILGSGYAFVIFLIYPTLLAKRIQNEEAVLLEQLDGYGDYMKKVRWRMIPFLW